MRRKLGSENENEPVNVDSPCENNVGCCLAQNQMACTEGAAYDETALTSNDPAPVEETSTCCATESCPTDLQQKSEATSVKYCTRKVTPPHKRQCLCRKLGKLESSKPRKKKFNVKFA